MRTGVVYLLTNNVNGNTYVGVTRFTSRARWTQHVYKARRGVKTRLYSAIRKYGPENFTVLDVASCLENPSGTERDVIHAMGPVYNQTNGGEITTGRRVPPEVVERIVSKNRGLKRTPEQNAENSRQAKERHANDPKYHARCVDQLRLSRETIDEEKRVAAVRAALVGKPIAPERVAALVAFNTGRKQPRHAVEARAAKKRKKVICVDLDRVFDSILEASSFLGISNSSIGKCCSGRLKTAGGYRFELVGG